MEPMADASTIEEALIRKAQRRKVPVNGSIELLPLCNMNCDMCYVRLSREEMERQGRLRTAEEWIDLGRQMQQAGVLFLLLTGGEPLLYPEFQTVYLALKELGMHLTINTNGTLIDEEWARFFGKHKPRRINISLYGADEAAYASLCHYPQGFERALRGIRLLQEQCVDVKIGVSVTKRNFGDIDRILDIGRALGVPVRMDTYMMPGVRERGRLFSKQTRLSPERAAWANVKALKGEMETGIWRQYVVQTLERVEQGSCNPGDRMTCLAGSCSFTINWQGEMRPCVVMKEPAAPVFDMGFAAAWEQNIAACAQIRLNAQCAGCALRPLCRTCAASAFLETGDYGGIPAYMCRYAEEVLRLLREEQLPDAGRNGRECAGKSIR